MYDARPQELLAVFAVPEDELTRLRALSPTEAEQAASDAQNDADELFKALDTDTDRELTLQELSDNSRGKAFFIEKEEL